MMIFRQFRKRTILHRYIPYKIATISMESGLTDEDFRQIKRFAETPRHERTPDLLRAIESRKSRTETEDEQE